MTPADLKQARLDLGLTQRRLGQQLGVPHTTIWRWEQAKHPIEHPRMLSLALHALAEMRNVRTVPCDQEDPEF